MTLIQTEPKKIYIWVEFNPSELHFTANTAGSTIALNKVGSPTSVTLEISTDGTNWSTYTFGTTITLANIGDMVLFRNSSATTTGFSTDGDNYYQFVMTGSIAAGGDVNYLLNKNSITNLSNFCFNYLFMDCTSLTTPPTLPATTLAQYCYRGMFNGCTNLTEAPELSVSNLDGYDGCYSSMFRGCTSLTIAPNLPAWYLSNACYATMFYGCTSLLAAPTLDATALAQNCYYFMFYGCTSLTTAPNLPATRVYRTCYYNMFNGCSNLTTLPALPTTGTLEYGCYGEMFSGCSKIKLSTTQTGEYQTAYRIPTSGTGYIDSYQTALMNMFTSTGGTFTGTPSINTTYYTSNTVV